MSESRLTPGDIVARVLERRPKRVRVFLARHMACPGCPVAAHATLGEAAATYGIAAAELIAALEAADQAER